MKIEDFQQQMRDVYLVRDRERGVYHAFLRFMEEVGELTASLRKEEKEDIAGEIADVIAWALSIANLYEIDAAQALRDKYKTGCSRCDTVPCSCPDK